MEAPFTFDTSGCVRLLSKDAPWKGLPKPDIYWSDLSPLTQGYVEALFRAACSGFEKAGFFMPYAEQPKPGMTATKAVGFSDLHPETLAAILKDCAALIADPFGYGRDANCGRYCWQMRQIGWEGGPLVNGPLPDAAALRERFPPQTPYLDDTGKVRLREASR